MSQPAQFDKFGFLAPDPSSLTMLGRSLDKNFGIVQKKLNTPPPSVYVYKSAVQSITSATFTSIIFDLEKFDTNNQHDNVINNTRLTCVDPGKYLIIGTVDFVNAALGRRNGNIFLNNTTILASDSRDTLGGGFDTVCNPITIFPLIAGDYLELRAYQDSGGAINVTNAGAVGCWFAMYKFSV